MRFTYIASLAALVAVAAADYNIWYRICSSGLAKLDAISVSDRQGVCYSKSCSVTGNLGAGDARGGNPVSSPLYEDDVMSLTPDTSQCNGRCQDDLIYRWKGGGKYDLIVAGTGIRIGECNAVQDTGAGGIATCRQSNQDCTMVRAFRCQTGYCNEPTKRARDLFIETRESCSMSVYDTLANFDTCSF